MQVSYPQIALAFASEPLVLMSLVTLVGALTTYLWRRKYAS